MSYFPTKLNNIMEQNNINLKSLSDKTSIDQMILKGYLTDLEPSQNHLKILSDFFKVSESELFFKNHKFTRGTITSQIKVTRLYHVIIVILGLVTIFNILFSMDGSHLKTGVFTQTIITVVSLIILFITKYLKDFSTLLKIRFNYFIVLITLSANLYVFSLYLLYGYSNDYNIFINEMVILIGLLPISWIGYNKLDKIRIDMLKSINKHIKLCDYTKILIK